MYTKRFMQMNESITNLRKFDVFVARYAVINKNVYCPKCQLRSVQVYTEHHEAECRSQSRFMD